MTSKRRPKTEDELDDDAMNVLCCADADKFARALDRCGWQIVVKPKIDNGQRWQMYGPGPCPEWADPRSGGKRPDNVVPFPRR
jgi:hypothetical protein